MGSLLKALTVSSAHRAKKTDLWPQLMERLGECADERALEDFGEWMSARRMDIPYAWDEPLLELIDKRRDEIRQEDEALLRSL